MDDWLPEPRLRADMSWPHQGTRVLDVECGLGRVVVKAAGPADHHIARELSAYRGFTDCLARTGNAPELLYSDRDANVLVLRYLPGSLVQGQPDEFSAAIHRNAGVLLRTFHSQAARPDPGWDAAAVAKSLAWLAKPHQIETHLCSMLRAILTGHRPQPTVVVPTHGDWHPRNWLTDCGAVRVIDFGRFAWRPAATDLCRLAAQQWRDRPALETAFFAGYGRDPREAAEWRMLALHEAIGTAVWAHQVGDAAFEQQGHRMIRAALQLF